MQSFRNPCWLIVINTIPVALLMWISFGTFEVIESILNHDNINLWIVFGAALGIIWLGHISYTLIWIFRKKHLNEWYGLVTLLVYVTFLYLYFSEYDNLIPPSIPRWMISENLIFYAGSFIMPTIVHSLFILVLAFTKNVHRQKPWLNFLLALGAPLGWYVLFQMIFPLWHRVEGFGVHLTVIITVTLTVAFLFFIIRGVYVLGTKRGEFFKQYELVLKIIIALAFPLTGLVVNNDMFFEFIFGNFSNPWFYILAVINGIAVCMPETNHRYFRLVVFSIRSITFTYILYFFLVFLPYLPLSVLAIVAFGLGFLMLTPLILIVFQTKMLVDDFTYLYNHYSRRTINVLFAASVLVIPVSVSAVYAKEKNVLQRALRYVYEPNYDAENETPINTASLQNVVNRIKENKRRSRNHIPFLTTYYNWLVLDNLTLSDEKIVSLERIFMGKGTNASPGFFPLRVNNPSSRVEITGTTTRSSYDKTKQTWHSEIEFEVQNQSSFQAEYATSFDLPDGAWINNYYLWINDEKVYGELAEKKAATWIYQQVTSYRQDPGILFYTRGNTISFRVFPFNPEETRTTGFQIIHKEPLVLKIDEQSIQLGDETGDHLNETFGYDGQAVYIPRDVKRKLKTVKRKPYYHFIIDCSERSESKMTGFYDRVNNFIKRNNLDTELTNFTFTNAYTKTYPYSPDLLSIFMSQEHSGGFFLENSLKRILYKSYTEPSGHYPVIVVVTDAMEEAIISNDLKDWRITFPESDYFYRLRYTGELDTHSLINDPLYPAKAVEATHKVAAWPGEKEPFVYVRVDDQPGVVINHSKTENKPARYKLEKDDWQSALTLQGKWIDHILHPEKTGSDWVDLVKGSFESHTMTNVTSFIALENEAQRQALRKKQEETMNAEKYLDIGEEGRMSEPGIILLVVLLLAAHGLKNKISVFTLG